MGNWNKNEVNQIPQGTFIFNERETADSIAIVLRGRIQIKNSGSSVIVGVGTFFGIPDVIVGRYQSSYIAYDDVIIFIYSMKGYNELKVISAVNKDYGGLMVVSYSRYIKELSRIEQLLKNAAGQIFEFLSVYSRKCLEIEKKSGYIGNTKDIITELEPYKENQEHQINQEMLEYYQECCTLPVSVMKEYYRNNIISTFHMKQQVPLTVQLIKRCTALACYIYEIFMTLFRVQDNCLFNSLIELLHKVKNDKQWKEEVTELIEKCIEQINNLEKLIHIEIDMDLNVDHEYLEHVYYQILSGDMEIKQEGILQTEEVLGEQEIVKQTTGMLDKLLGYAKLDTVESDEWHDLMQQFKNLSDKLSSENEARQLRKKITNKYYELYYKVYISAYETRDESLFIQLFLNYGIVDETLLDKEQIIYLSNILKGEIQHQSCRVYTIREWLDEIYMGNIEPSKSEFDLDYADAVRERKRLEKLSDGQVMKLKEDRKAKLKYELDNMFKYNNRVCSGRISTFVPFLYKEVFYGTIEKAFHQAEEINATINRLLSVDFSIFYRESLYYDTEKGIKKEYIMEQVFPDIILLPICGTKGIMWQEITGRKRNSSGRFLLPVLNEENLNDIMVQLFGRFRWEICRTVQGTAWNNIQYPSLTSEYYDYIQFYHKNRELTTEKKEKVKSQVAKGRGNMREVFLKDYIAWVTREYRGEIRLNKVARGILGTYIPFRQDIREKISIQPMFKEAINRYERNKKHTIREMELRIKGLERDGIEVPQVILDTLEYWMES